jgi:hypothetical protein
MKHTSLQQRQKNTVVKSFVTVVAGFHDRSFNFCSIEHEMQNCCSYVVRLDFSETLPEPDSPSIAKVIIPFDPLTVWQNKLECFVLDKYF